MHMYEGFFSMKVPDYIWNCFTVVTIRRQENEFTTSNSILAFARITKQFTLLVCIKNSRSLVLYVEGRNPLMRIVFIDMHA